VPQEPWSEQETLKLDSVKSWEQNNADCCTNQSISLLLVNMASNRRESGPLVGIFFVRFAVVKKEKS